jgi:TRAP-type mannitol/chloroaromatic compound transport system substrate-binding protein
MRRFLQGLSAIGLIATATSGVSAQEFSWRMATMAPSETSTYFRLFAQPLAENIAKLTNGRVEITPYPAGVLAPGFEVYDAVLDGRADVGNTWPGYIVNQNPANSLFSAHPGGMGVDVFLSWLYAGGGQELWRDFRREELGLYSVVAGAAPGEIHMHSHKPVKEIADLAGLRMRITGAAAEILTNLGGAPVTVPGNEVYTMLERSAVDATEWSTPADNVNMGLHEIAPYVIIPGIHQPSLAFEFVMPAATWNKLPADIQEQIEAAAKLTTFTAYEAWAAEDLEAMQTLHASNIEIIRLSEEYLDAWRTAGREWTEEKGGDNEWVRRISESYYGFLEAWEENMQYMLVNQPR